MGSKAADSSANSDPVKTPASSKAASPEKKTPTPRKRRAKTGTDKAQTASDLKQELKALEVRLDRADDVTRSSVQSLETVVTALQANLKNATASQKGQLTKQVNLLTKRLDDQTAQTRAVIRNELKAALSQGGLDRFGEAIDSASAKLDAAEIKQANAVARLNKHLADMARAVDARFKQESDAREAAIADVSDDLTHRIQASQRAVENRVAQVEKDSADALHKVGEAIELVHDSLKTRQDSSRGDVAEKVNELAVQTQAELEAYQAKLDTRLEDFEARQLAVGAGAAERVVEKATEDFDFRLDGLQRRLSELEKLERFAADTRASAQSLPEPPPLPLPAADTSPFGGTPPPSMPPNPVQMLRDRLNGAPPVTIPQGPAGGPNSGPMASLAPNPYASALELPMPDPEPIMPFGTAAVQPKPSHIPEEFDPQSLRQPQTPTAPPLQPPSPVLPFPQANPPSNINPDGPPPLPPFQPPSGLVPPMAPSAPPADGFEPAPLPDAVYANPAYAEDGVDGSPVAVRIADDGKRTRKRKTSLTKTLSGSSALSGRNIKLALLVAGVAFAALLAARMILSGPAPSDPNAIQGAAPAQSQEFGTDTLDSGAITFTDPSVDTLDPIGDYAEAQPVMIDGAQLDTLDAAVAAGNSIAQFQMGLAKLEAGDTEAGAALIRQSASANQPAALYRLAKLYEAGEGVPQDDTMARQLIERAARGGNRIAMHDLALYYTEGRGGVGMDMQTARSWFEQAARRGVVDSQFNLAVLAESAQVGDTPDVGEALFWYSIAANQGDQFAVTRRDTLRVTQSAEALDALDARVAAFAPRAIDEAANGIFTDVPWISQSALSGDPQVRQVQSLLSSLGYPVGVADGVMGAKTRSAIREFQEANGLRQTGEVTGTLIQRLANAAGA